VLVVSLVSRAEESSFERRALHAGYWRLLLTLCIVVQDREAIGDHGYGHERRIYSGSNLAYPPAVLDALLKGLVSFS
jgi:hypothetical protein